MVPSSDQPALGQVLTSLPFFTPLLAQHLGPLPDTQGLLWVVWHPGCVQQLLPALALLSRVITRSCCVGSKCWRLMAVGVGEQ